MRKTLLVLAATAALSQAAGAQTLLTASFGGTQATQITNACPSSYCFGNGPTAIGANGYNVTYTAVEDVSFGQSPLLSGPGGRYDLAGNGIWSGVAYAATNGTSSVWLTFSAPVTAVGGIMNYCDGECRAAGTAWLRGYDSSNNLIASYDLFSAAGGISTPNGTDQGAFRGIAYAGGISAIEIQGGYVLTQDLEATTVPEPSTIGLMGAGMLGLVALRRRQRVS
ncbi:MAG: PEP-CTERM sorting domain-containing protein [Gemmatimonadota bacterium]|nr:PEP-CTERM sorting domain-containing protein [Gemmatimonadota bacterium]MDQ8168746.1 PEP-CTERM sorting domain-containing protein [Gemmatimonadota bacterium]MDQ8172921.1 PEP-CTERM sorting domain-containing protein [Gemmatimonadota bacterium]